MSCGSSDHRRRLEPTGVVEVIVGWSILGKYLTPSVDRKQQHEVGGGEIRNVAALGFISEWLQTRWWAR